MGSADVVLYAKWTHRKCVPCWDPFTGVPNGACSLSSCDSPPAQAYTFPNCCMQGNVAQGRCVPRTQIASSSQSSLTQNTCSSQYLCVPLEDLPSPYGVAPQQCTATSFTSSNHAGVCLSNCHNLPFGYTQSNCPAHYTCISCADIPGLPGCL